MYKTSQNLFNDSRFCLIIKKKRIFILCYRYIGQYFFIKISACSLVGLASMKSLLQSASREGRRSTRIVLSPRGGFHKDSRRERETPSSSLVGVKRTAGRGPVHTSGPLYEANITWPARAFLSLSRSERPVAYSTTKQS